MPNSPSASSGCAMCIFLWYLVNQKGILVDLAKIKDMMQWEVPRSPSKVQIFLGLVGYYLRFMKNLSRIAVPLTKLTKKTALFIEGLSNKRNLILWDKSCVRL